MSPPSFFLAGTMQGSRKGAAELEQDYRRVLREVILKRHADARVVCPRELLHHTLASGEARMRAAHAKLAERASVIASDLPKPIERLREVFVELTDLAATFDVLVAYLPGHEASMGTAVEMWSAKKGGAAIISITEMSQNLAVLAMSDAIVPSIDAFGALLDTGFIARVMGRAEPGRSAPGASLRQGGRLSEPSRPSSAREPAVFSQTSEES